MPRRHVLMSALRRCLTAALLVTIATALQATLLERIVPHHPLLVYFPVVALAAFYLGVLGGLTAIALSALLAGYLWMVPAGQFQVTFRDDQLYLALFVAEGIAVSCIAEMVRRAKLAETRARLAAERQRAEEKVQESEQRLRLALEGGQMGLMVWDIRTDSLEWNQQEYELLGLPVGDGHESMGTFRKRVHPDDLQRVERALHEMLEQGTEFQQEFRIVRPDGEMRWLMGRGRLSRDPDGTPGLMRGVNYDITSRKAMEEVVARSEAEARARADELAVLMDTVPAITFIAHDPECRRMSGSRKSREFLRVPETKSVSVSAPEEEQPDSFRLLKDGRELAPEEFPLQLAAKGQEVRGYEVTVVFNDGTSRDICGDAVPLLDAAGTVRGAIGAFLDITELKRMQQELQKARDGLEKRVAERTAELQQAMEALRKETEERMQVLDALHQRDQLLIRQSRLAAMGEMINNIAHQWRQPLNTMGLIVQELPAMYRQGVLSEGYLTGQIEKAHLLLRHMSQTVDDFRSFFSPGIARTSFTMPQLIAKTLVLVEDTLAAARITVEVEVVDAPVICGYLNECCHVLLNILLNARDAFLEAAAQTTRVIRMRAFTEGGKAVVTIADNAGGIPEDILERVFDPYFTTKGPERGTGIGLFMVRAILEKHPGGSCTVRNVDGGAEFRIELGATGPGDGAEAEAGGRCQRPTEK